MSNEAALLESLRQAPTGASGVLALQLVMQTELGRSAEHLGVMPDEAVMSWLEQVSLLTVKQLFVRAAVSVGGLGHDELPPLLVEALQPSKVREIIRRQLSQRFGEALSSSLDPSNQVVWLSSLEGGGLGPPIDSRADPCVAWATWPPSGVFSSLAEPAAVEAAKLAAWDQYFGPLTCWKIEPIAEARILEIGASADWQELIERYPLERHRRPNSRWEIPGLNPQKLGALHDVAAQCVARTAMSSFVEPDWNEVRSDYDAVHLTWAGFLDCEGRVIELGRERIGMLRAWGSERTLWLNPVLRVVRPLPCSGVSMFDDQLLCQDLLPGDSRALHDLAMLEGKGLRITGVEQSA